VGNVGDNSVSSYVYVFISPKAWWQKHENTAITNKQTENKET